MKSYETILEMYSKQLTSLSSYTLCTEDLFSDQIYNIGRIQVCFFVTQHVYPRLPKHEQQQCHEAVCVWFAKFKQKCPDYITELDHMRKTWDLDSHATRTWFSMSPDIAMNTMNYMFVCVDCGQEFHAKAHLLRHSVVHKAGSRCGNCSPKHKCKHVSTTNMTKQESLKTYIATITKK